jgi:hypothetical protein
VSAGAQRSRDAPRHPVVGIDKHEHETLPPTGT